MGDLERHSPDPRALVNRATLPFASVVICSRADRLQNVRSRLIRVPTGMGKSLSGASALAWPEALLSASASDQGALLDAALSEVR